jgi:site-specific DNA recombinase
MSRAIVYSRVSTNEQVENHSLATQERSCLQYCRQHGLEVVGVFREEGESAKSAKRPELQAMINFCVRESKRQNICSLVVYRVDRLARSVYDHGAIRAQMRSLGIQIRAVQETFDDSPAGQFMENIMAAVAQLDNDVRALRTSDGMKEALRQGRWAWKPPIGYRKPPPSPVAPSLEPDPEAAHLVRAAFEHAATGLNSRQESLEHVTALGLRTKKGKPLPKQTFDRMLRNEIYTGRIVVRGWGFEGPGDFEPLISPELFEAVRRGGARKPSARESRRLDNPDFPLRRVVKCPECGAPVTGSWSKGRRERYAYYRCPRAGCGGMSYRKAVLEEMFLEYLNRQIVKPAMFALFRAVVEDAWNERISGKLATRLQLEQRIAALEQKRDRLVDAFVHDRVIAQDTYDSQQERVRRELAAAEGKLGETSYEVSTLPLTLDFAEALLSDLPACWNRLPARQRPAFLRSLYPHGLTLQGGRIGTAEIPWIVRDFGTPADSKSELVPPTGFEPVLPA